MTDEDIKWKYSGEVTTCNKFELLDQEDTLSSSTCKEGTLSSSKKNKNFKFNHIVVSDFSFNFNFNDSQTCDTQKSVNNDYVNSNSKFITQKSVLNNSYNEFMSTKDKLLNSNKHYMYSNKHNFCSGYLPDFITLDSIDGYNFSKGSDYSHYYLYINNNIYLKPLSSSLSKYNNEYFDKLRHAYKISKKFRNSILKDTERSIPIMCNSVESKRGFNETDNNNNNNNSRNNNSNCSKLKCNNKNNHNSYSNINPKDSERGMLGNPKYMQGYGNNNNNISNNINNNRNNSNNCKKDGNNNIIGNNNDINIPRGSERGMPRGSKRGIPEYTDYENTLYHSRNISNINNSKNNSNNCNKYKTNNDSSNPRDSERGIPRGSERGTPENTVYENTLYHGKITNNIINNKNNSNNCDNCNYNNNNNNSQIISNQGNKSGHYDQSQGRYKPDHYDQSLKRDFNQNNSREYIQYSNPHYQYEIVKEQIHRNHSGHICDHSCKGFHNGHEHNQTYPQRHEYRGGHRYGHRCKSDLPDQYLYKCKPGLNNQYLSDGNGHRNHCDCSCGCGNGIDQHNYQKSDDINHIHSRDHRCNPGHPDQFLNKCKPGQHDQYLNGHCAQRKEKKTTPDRGKRPRPRINLFQNPEEDLTDIEIVPVNTDLEVLLINSWKIDAPKVQTIVEDFIRDKNYTTIFCLTETKVEGHDFQPEGIKIFSKQRKRKTEKFGGGLALGYAEETNVELQEIKIKSSDILAVEGKIHNKKFRIILCYFSSKKLLKGT